MFAAIFAAWKPRNFRTQPPTVDTEGPALLSCSFSPNVHASQPKPRNCWVWKNSLQKSKACQDSRVLTGKNAICDQRFCCETKDCCSGVISTVLFVFFAQETCKLSRTDTKQEISISESQSQNSHSKIPYILSGGSVNMSCILSTGILQPTKQEFRVLKPVHSWVTYGKQHLWSVFPCVILSMLESTSTMRGSVLQPVLLHHKAHQGESTQRYSWTKETTTDQEL